MLYKCIGGLLVKTINFDFGIKELAAKENWVLLATYGIVLTKKLRVNTNARQSTETRTHVLHMWVDVSLYSCRWQGNHN